MHPTFADLEALQDRFPVIRQTLDQWKRGRFSLEQALTIICVLMCKSPTVNAETAPPPNRDIQSKEGKEAMEWLESLIAIKKGLEAPEAIKLDLPADPTPPTGFLLRGERPAESK